MQSINSSFACLPIMMAAVYYHARTWRHTVCLCGLRLLCRCSSDSILSGFFMMLRDRLCGQSSTPSVEIVLTESFVQVKDAMKHMKHSVKHAAHKVHVAGHKMTHPNENH